MHHHATENGRDASLSARILDGLRMFRPPAAPCPLHRLSDRDLTDLGLVRGDLDGL